MAWTLPTAVLNARIAAAANAVLTLAQAGSGSASTIRLYGALSGGSRPLLGTITLASPPGTVTAEGKIQLAQASDGDTVAATGIPEYAEWCNRDGTAIAACTVGPSSAGADLTVTSRADGMVFAGGQLVLTGGVVG